jgi:hypothetical protein
LLKIRTFDPQWTLPSQMDQNPMFWMVQVNGFIVDARHLKREIQEELVQLGVIILIIWVEPVLPRRMAFPRRQSCVVPSLRPLS